LKSKIVPLGKAQIDSFKSKAGAFSRGYFSLWYWYAKNEPVFLKGEELGNVIRRVTNV
jgi:hypothetical protein